VAVSVDPAAVEAEIDLIRSLGLDALRVRWRATFGRTPPAGLTKDIMGRMLAWRIQEQAFGGLDRATLRLLDGLAKGDKSGLEGKRHLKAGTVLIREYRGERHTVTVVPDGFLWQGTTYGSLSTIAHGITGTKWNGPRFFGLRMARDGADGADASRSAAGAKKAERNRHAGLRGAKIQPRRS
jgi:Protein of unknown function (DUF2924)